MEKEFPAFRVCEIVGINQNQLTTWLARGHIKASTPAEGSGTRNIFTVQDIFRIEMFKRLSKKTSRSRAALVAFPQKRTEATKRMNTAISKAVKGVIKHRADIDDTDKTILAKAPKPDPLYIAAYEYPEGLMVSILQSSHEFSKLYQLMRGQIDFQIINLTKIAERILDKIAENKG